MLSCSISRYFSRFVRLFLQIVLTFSGLAHAHANACYQTHTKTSSESSIEIEFAITEKTVDVLTAEDNSLDSLFMIEDAIPSPVIEEINRKSESKSKDVFSFPFESLSSKSKVQALKASIIHRNLRFGHALGGSRIIPGIKIKDSYAKQFELQNYVEMGAPSTAKDGSLVEIHMRSRQASGDLMLQAAKLASRLGMPRKNIHEHVVFPMPLRWLHQNPGLNSLRLAEFWRRVNLAFEMREVVEQGNSLGTKKDDRLTSFSVLGSLQLVSGMVYLEAMGKHYDPTISDLKDVQISLESEAKMGWVGMWGADKYDGKNLMGFEFRFLVAGQDGANVRKFLNNVADQVSRLRFGLSEADLIAWRDFGVKLIREEKDEYKKKIHETMLYPFLLPHQEYLELTSQLEPAFQKILLGLDQKATETAFQQRPRLKYLVHNWAMDPLIFGKPEAISKIRESQLRALRRWARGENEREVVQEFLMESGLYFAFSDSIGFVP